MSNLLVNTMPSPDARARCFYILLVACFPLVVAGMISAMVFASGAVQRGDGIGHKTEFAQIDFPQPGDVVEDQFELRGRLTSVPEGESVYLVEVSEGRIWPKTRLGASPTSFTRQQTASAGSGYKYSVELLSVKPAGEEQIEQWFKKGQKTGKYPGITDIEASTVLVRTRVIRQ